MSRIDEFSRLLGALETSVTILTSKIDDNREVASIQHSENREALQELDSHIRTLTLDVKEIRSITTHVIATANFDRARIDAKISELEKEAVKSKQFREWLAPRLVVAVAFVSGFLWIVWTGIQYFSAEVKGWLSRLFS